MKKSPAVIRPRKKQPTPEPPPKTKSVVKMTEGSGLSPTFNQYNNIKGYVDVVQ